MKFLFYKDHRRWRMENSLERVKRENREAHKETIGVGRNQGQARNGVGNSKVGRVDSNLNSRTNRRGLGC